MWECWFKQGCLNEDLRWGSKWQGLKKGAKVATETQTWQIKKLRHWQETKLPVTPVDGLSNYMLCFQADQPGLCSWTCEAGKGPRIQAGKLDRRGDLCTCEQGECCVCACTSDLISLPAREEEGVSTICVYVLHESCWKQPLAEAACMTGHVSVLCVSVTLG